MAVTQAPAVEACEAIVSRINSGTAYCLDLRAEYVEQIVDDLIDLRKTHVDVVPEEEEQLDETLDVENRTSHTIRVHVRTKVNAIDSDDVAAFKLLVRQIFQRVNNYDTADGRVKVWECDLESKQVPDKTILQQNLLCVASILLRVEVEPSA
jgi:hypothetical protein